MTTHSSILAWTILRTKEPGVASVHRVAKSRTRLSDSHFHIQEFGYIRERAILSLIYDSPGCSYNEKRKSVRRV